MTDISDERGTKGKHELSLSKKALRAVCALLVIVGGGAVFKSQDRGNSSSFSPLDRSYSSSPPGYNADQEAGVEGDSDFFEHSGKDPKQTVPDGRGGEKRADGIAKTEPLNDNDFLILMDESSTKVQNSYTLHIPKEVAGVAFDETIEYHEFRVERQMGGILEFKDESGKVFRPDSHNFQLQAGDGTVAIKFGRSGGMSLLNFFALELMGKKSNTATIYIPTYGNYNDVFIGFDDDTQVRGIEQLNVLVGALFGKGDENGAKQQALWVVENRTKGKEKIDLQAFPNAHSFVFSYKVAPSLWRISPSKK